MKHVFVIHGVQYGNSLTRRTGHEKGPEWMNMCFLTLKEAEDFCSYHSGKGQILFWKKVVVGKFAKPRKKK